MTSFSQIIRAIANILLFAIYALIANTLVGFIVGWFIKYVLGYSIPAE